MIQAMTLAGLSAGTQAAYLRAVWHLAKYYRRAPDQLSEEEVRAYLLDRKRGGADTLRNAGKMRSPVVLGRGRQDAGRGVGV